MNELIEDIRTVANWLGWECEKSKYNDIDLEIVDTQATEHWIDPDRTDTDTSILSLAMEIMAAVNDRPGELPRSVLSLCVYTECAYTNTITHPPRVDGYWDTEQHDNTDPLSIARAIIRVAANRARWESKG